jgi:hypothetical protein
MAPVVRRAVDPGSIPIEIDIDALGLGPNAGLPPDVQALARTRELELSGLGLDAALEAKITGLDLNTEEGRQAFLEFNRMLFRMAENGDITADHLGTF